MHKWKIYVVLIVLGMFGYTACYAQEVDLTGKWTGYLTRVIKGKRQKLHFEMQLTQNGSFVSGASVLAINDTTTCTTVIRCTWGDNILNYKELDFIKIRGGVDEENWCLKQSTFSFSRKDGKDRLIGNWTGRTTLDEWCEPGIIVATRPATGPPTESTPEEESIKPEELVVRQVDLKVFDPMGEATTANVEVRDIEGRVKYREPVMDVGNLFELEQGKYMIWIYKKGYVHIQREIKLSAKNQKWHFQLNKVEKGHRFVIEGLYFEQSQAVITAKSQPALEHLAEFLKENPNCTIRIVGHTDNIGNAYLNRILSLNRARAVARYLVVDAGIDRNRLMPPVGKGGDEPLVERPDASGHSMNRRVEVEIVDAGS